MFSLENSVIIKAYMFSFWSLRKYWKQTCMLSIDYFVETEAIYKQLNWKWIFSLYLILWCSFYRKYWKHQDFCSIVNFQILNVQEIENFDCSSVRIILLLSIILRLFFHYDDGLWYNLRTKRSSLGPQEAQWKLLLSKSSGKVFKFMQPFKFKGSFTGVYVCVCMHVWERVSVVKYSYLCDHLSSKVNFQVCICVWERASVVMYSNLCD